jgi:hypothetical protein
MTGAFSDGSNGTTSASKRAYIEDELTETRRFRRKLEDTVDKIVTSMEANGARKSPEMDRCIRQVANYSQMMVDSSVLDTISSPASKSVYLDTLKKQRKNLLEKMNADNESNS